MQFQPLEQSRRFTATTTLQSSTTVRRVDDVERPLQLLREDVVVAPPVPDAIASDGSDWLTRSVNVVLASVALVALSPLLLLVALAIRLTSPGPILHVQIRVGLDRRGRRDDRGHDRRLRDLGGRAFRIYKFRSMYVDAEKRSGAVWATKNDPRITPIGRFIRKVRIDEIPQLINVIKGEMNIVGPRPERPTIFAQLRDTIEDYPLRQLAKPGITGWAQINQSYDACLDDVRNKVRFDLEYIRRRSVSHDLSIMLKTLPVMIFRKGGW